MTERHAIEAGIYSQVMADADFIRSGTVFIFHSVRDEISTLALIEACLQQGKTVCLPRCGSCSSMTARRITSLSDLEIGSMDIPTPSLQCTSLSPEQLDIAIVPCLCADLWGDRLGYGAGYYDRYLAQTTAVSMILCAKQFLFNRLPTDCTDVSCDKIATESEVVLPHEK